SPNYEQRFDPNYPIVAEFLIKSANTNVSGYLLRSAPPLMTPRGTEGVKGGNRAAILNELQATQGCKSSSGTLIRARPDVRAKRSTTSSATDPEKCSPALRGVGRFSTTSRTISPECLSLTNAAIRGGRGEAGY